MINVEFPKWSDSYQLKGHYPPEEWVYDVLEIIGTVGCGTIAQAIQVWDNENPQAFRDPVDEYHSFILAKSAVQYEEEDSETPEDELDYGGRFFATDIEHKTYNKLRVKYEE